MPGARLAFGQCERVLYRQDERPVKVEQRDSGAAREDNPNHRSARRSALGELVPEFLERDGFVPRKLSDTGLDRGQRLGVGQNLCGLLERLVLVDRDERGRRPAVSCDEYVVAAIRDVAEQLTQVASKLSNGHGARHRTWVYPIVYIRYAATPRYLSVRDAGAAGGRRRLRP